MVRSGQVRSDQVTFMSGQVRSVSSSQGRSCHERYRSGSVRSDQD